MHRLLTITAAIACCAGFGAAVGAASCDDRFPGSCRTEVSSTVIEGVPGAAAKAETRKSRQVTRRARAEIRKARAEARKARAAKRIAGLKRSKPASREETERVAAIPLPQPRPAETAIQDDNLDLEKTTEPSPQESPRASRRDIIETVGWTTPHLVVDETFNLLLAHEPGDTTLESALLSRRDQMVGSAPREPRD